MMVLWGGGKSEQMVGATMVPLNQQHCFLYRSMFFSKMEGARVSCHWLACLASQHRVRKKLIVSVFKQKILLKETAVLVLTLQSVYVKRNGNCFP
jgi:hypothetical protein